MPATQPQDKCLIIGHGEMGQAFEYLLGSDRVDVWQRRSTEPLESMAQHRRFIFLCIPATPVHDVALQLRDTVTPDTVCLSIAKGLDNDGRPAAMAMAAALGDRCVRGIIHGPMISEELRAGRPGFGELAVSRDNAVTTVLELFADSLLRLHPNDDLAGLTWCAILKNVYAMAFGMADELDLGVNVRGYLSVTAMQELSRISVALGGQPGTPYGLAGLGDLITTATSEDSHHHGLGRQLARGERANLRGEGIHTLQMVIDRKLLNTREFPLFSAVQDIVLGGKNAAPVLDRLIRA